MAEPNITDRRFFMTATKPIQAKFLINPGDNVLIDPDKLPEPGNMVLIGDNLEWWNGQHEIRGVAISVETDLIKDAATLEKEADPFTLQMLANLRAIK